MKKIDERGAAVLVDGENVSPQYLPHIEERLGEFRRDIRRVYGDWVRPDLAPWRSIAETSGYRLVQVTRQIQGKSAVDQGITIDAMDIFAQGRVSAICLVTSDTDFIPLLHRLREGHMLTILIGDQRASSGLRNAAHQFFELPGAIQRAELPASTTSGEVTELLPHLIAAYEATARGGMANLAAFGTAMKKRIPAFSPKDYGEKGLRDILSKFPDVFVVLSEDRGEHPPTHYVRRKDT